MDQSAMNRKDRKHQTDNIPFLRDLASFYKHVNARPPLNKDFDIREIDPEVLKGYDYTARPFHHSFYCITFLLEGDVTLNSGFWKQSLKKPALYFKTPYQLVSWIKPERWLKEYFIVFTEDFMLRHKPLADIIFALPFFKLEKAIPFEIGPDDVKLLTNLYRQILLEYRTDNGDKFEMIASYTHTLLMYVRRLYFKYVETDKKLLGHIQQAEDSLVERFLALIRKALGEKEVDKRVLNVKFFASQLSTHPNHLNAVVKGKTQKTAIQFIHEQIIHEAKSLLSQTLLSVKEISFRVGYSDVAHFTNFFKKKTGTTPVLYRKGKIL